MGRRKPTQAEPTRLEKLTAQAEKLTADREALAAKLERLAEREKALRVEAIRRSPGTRSDAKGALSEPAKLVREQDEARRTLDALDHELAALAEVLQEERQAEQERVFEEAMAGFADYDHRELALKAQMTAAYQAFEAAYRALRALSDERRNYGAQYAFAEQQQAKQFRDAGKRCWTPTSLEAAFERVWRDALKAAQPPIEVFRSEDPDAPPVPDVKPSYLPGWGPAGLEQEKRARVAEIL